MESNAVNYLDLFSGIGGFAYAAELAGVPINPNAHYYSDISPESNQVYAKHFPTAVSLGDITQIDGKALKAKHPGDWVICGGFPCQDASTAGKRAGINGSRTGLWFHYARLIDELKPIAIIAENVQGICSAGLDRVLFSLAQLRYDAEWQCISAASIGAPHLRKRIWIVAYPAADTDVLRQPATGKPSAIGRELGNLLQTNDKDNRGTLRIEGQATTVADATVHGCGRAPEPYPASLGRNVANHRELDSQGNWSGT